MNWEVLIMFCIGLGCYLLGIAVFIIVKAILYKRRFKKEIKDHEEEQDKNSNA